MVDAVLQVCYGAEMKIQTIPIARLRLKRRSQWLLGYQEVAAGPKTIHDRSAVSQDDMFDPGKPLDVTLSLVTDGPLSGCVEVTIGEVEPSIFYPGAIEAIELMPGTNARRRAER
jgi:hypothetical protein